jgi:hypothetical protein
MRIGSGSECGVYSFDPLIPRMHLQPCTMQRPAIPVPCASGLHRLQIASEHDPPPSSQFFTPTLECAYACTAASPTLMAFALPIMRP